LQTLEIERMRVRLAVVALAAERYRLAHKRWPNSLDDLVPDYLSKVPADPFADEPLHCEHHECFEIVAKSGKFQVWDVGQRGIRSVRSERTITGR
jgi:hypothetical protein